MRIMIVGASGLVGQGVLAACRNAPDVDGITLLGRRRLDTGAGPTEQLVVPDLRDIDVATPALAGLDACLYCAGTVPGLSAAAFREVTVDLTLHVARAFAGANPNGTFVYVSGAGANAASAVMPLRIKGEAEDALRALPLRTVMLRPGVVQPVDGVRSPHALRNAGYVLASPLLSAAARALPGVATTSGAVGRAMLAALRMQEPPAVLENRDINRLGAACG